MSHDASGVPGSFDDEAPPDLIAPSPDVYSYFLLTAPTERKKHHHFTVDALTSYVLVFSVLFIQCTLLFCVANKVIAKNNRWQQGIMNTGQDWNIADQKTSGCNDGKSLCRIENGTFTCAPPSVQLISRWNELDTNNDGVWTREEVTRDRDALKCKFAVDPIEVFNVLGRLLRERDQFIWLHPDIKSGNAIPKAYFTYIKGDVAMCGYRNSDMCGNLIKRGVFDVALIHGNVPRIGNTTTSALEYCHSLLDVGGLCERNLPSTYSVWKIKSVQECAKPEYEQFVFKHPKDSSVRSLLAVDYQARQNYEVAQSGIFITYKTCIIFVWMLLIVSQLREVRRTFAWIHQVPLMSEEQQNHVEDGEKQQIHTISKSHRVALIIVNGLRVTIMCVLLYVGLNFLARQTDYIGLLLDGVALIFIVEVEEIVYDRVIRQDVRASWEKRSPMSIKQNWLTRHPDILDLAFFCVLVVAAVCFMWYYTTSLVDPLYDALQCTCLSEGETCREADAFSKRFWDQYWKYEVPTSIGQINDLKYAHVQDFHADKGHHAHAHHAYKFGTMVQRHAQLRHLLPGER